MRFSVGCNGMGISIHAPAKGATFTAYYPANNALISIHAPAKGATSPLHSVLPVSKLFQSTLPRRERRMSTGGCGMAQKFQSTLPRRERLGLPRLTRRYRLFQSTLPRRERHPSHTPILPHRKFQSTLPRRERPASDSAGTTILYFNPRSREGSDTRSRSNSSSRSISIHAPAKGATCLWSARLATQTISIHAPAKGATNEVIKCKIRLIFQSTLPRRERQEPVYMIYHWYEFQSTLPRRERPSPFRL